MWKILKHLEIQYLSKYDMISLLEWSLTKLNGERRDEDKTGETL